MTAHVAGHSLGGAIWGINVGGEDVVYASDFNHSRDRHLEGATLAKLFDRPALAVVGAQFERLPRAPVTRVRRDRELLGKSPLPSHPPRPSHCRGVYRSVTPPSNPAESS